MIIIIRNILVSYTCTCTYVHVIKEVVFKEEWKNKYTL